jgi:hypothetical protein
VEETGLGVSMCVERYDRGAAPGLPQGSYRCNRLENLRKFTLRLSPARDRVAIIARGSRYRARMRDASDVRPGDSFSDICIYSAFPALRSRLRAHPLIPDLSLLVLLLSLSLASAYTVDGHTWSLIFAHSFFFADGMCNFARATCKDRKVGRVRARVIRSVRRGGLVTRGGLGNRATEERERERERERESRLR